MMSVLFKKRTVSVFLSSWFDTTDFHSKIESSCDYKRGQRFSIFLSLESSEAHQPVYTWVLFKDLTIENIHVRCDTRKGDECGNRPDRSMILELEI